MSIGSEFPGIVWDHWSIAALEWVNSEDFAIDMISPIHEKPLRVLFIWVTKLVIDFKFGGYSGLPLIFKTTYQRGPEGIDIEMVFGSHPDGRLALHCNSLVIEDGSPKPET